MDIQDACDNEIDQMPKTEQSTSISDDNQATSVDTSSINSTKLSDTINDQVEEVTLMETSNEAIEIVPTVIVKEETEDLQKVIVTDEQKNVEKDVSDSNISQEIKEETYVLTEPKEISEIVEKIDEADELPSNETIVDDVSSLYVENPSDIETVVVSKEELPSNFGFVEECSIVPDIPEKSILNNDNESLKEDVILCATTKEVDLPQQEVEKVTVADEGITLPVVQSITTESDDGDKKKVDQSLESGNFSLVNTTEDMENSIVDDAFLATDDKNLVNVGTIATDTVEVDENMLIDDSKKELTEDGTYENDMVAIESNQIPLISSTKDVINYTNCDSTSNAENLNTETSVTAVCDENDTRVTANITSCEVSDTRYGSETDDSLSLKPKKGSFSLGVPGLSFSSQNVRVANDGTKLVQIHQSQITPAQLQALQANPNIKVVFRHIPSGKSFTKPPKNLFNTLGKSRNKRKSENLDDSVYNFDDDYSSDYGATARSRDDTKFARYHPYNSNKRRRPGRPRTLPDSNLALLASNKSRISSITSQVRLNDVLVKLNKPTATKKLKIRISQVTIECLEKMELNPEYSLSVITKEDSEKEESEKINEVNQEEEEAGEDQNSDEKMEVDPDPVEDPNPVKEVAEETEKLEDQEKAAPVQEEEAKSENSESKKKVASKPAFEDQLRIVELERRERREREEAELYASVLSEQKSRSGRRRKPSRFSLDIARLTKRKSGYSSHDEDFLIPSVPSPRGQKRKGVSEEENVEKKQKVEKKPEAVDHTSIIPRVFLSLADQRVVEDVMIKKKLLSPRKEEEKSSEEGDGKKSEKEDTADAGAENLLDLVAQYFGTSKKSEEKSGEDEKKDEEEKKSNEEVEKEESNEKDSSLDAESKTEDDSKDKKDEEKVETPKDETEDSKIADADDSAVADSSEVESNDNNKPMSGENPSDILARKLDLLESKKLSAKPDDQPSAISDFIEEDGDVDNKYRLRKLLQQCSIEEIMSVAIPQALNSISIGDFFLYKSGQMSKEKVSYAALYKQLEALHMSVQKESARYTTLLRRANKVGGDRRLDKVILMPVYNKQAADALNINLSSIDAHIGNIQSHPTAQMMAANSFRLNCKMEPPLHRLDLPMLYDYKQPRRRPSPRMSDLDGMNMPSFNSPKRWSQQSRATYGSSARNMSYKPRSVYQQRKTNYMATSSTTSATTSMQSTSMSSRPESQALREQARLQLASRHQSPFDHMKVDNGPVPNTHVSTSDVDQSLGQISVEGSTTNVMTSVVPTTQTIATTGVEEAVAVSAAGAQQQVMMDDGSIVTAEEGKQLVSIGDGQYFELPEGYTLIQTDEGFVIGHPGTQFVQGDDGQVYMTSGEEVSSSDQILTTTTTGVGESDNAEQLLQHLNQS